MAGTRTDRTKQLHYFSEVDPRHFRWQTGDGYFAATEKALVRSLGLPTGGRVLEIGCGEGANLLHLGAKDGWVGVDFAQGKLAFARSSLGKVFFARADVAHLPFPDGTFDAILIRDVLHHVPDRQAALGEAFRVLGPGGTLGVIEPNRGSPLVLAQALLVPAERAVLASHRERIASELRHVGLRDVNVEASQPLPLARALLHPALKLSTWATPSPLVSFFETADRLFRRLLPKAAWFYLVGKGTKVLR
jgi:ubiquinone/menaquinone biosynthesis C-methylase UbiE